MVYEELECLNLEPLWLSKVLNAAKYQHFVLVRKSLVSVLYILSSEPGVLEAGLGRDTLGRVLLKHLGNKIFSLR